VQRVKLPVRNERRTEPAGSVLMGNSKKVGRTVYVSGPLNGRSIYVGAYDIDKYSITTGRFLKCVMVSITRC